MAHKNHIAVIPFPFGSHPRPLFNLLLKLAKSSPNLLFSFFTIPNSNPSLLSSDQPPQNVRFFNVESGIPADYKFTGNPVEPLDLFLKSAAQNVKKAIESAVADTGIKITGLITDAFLSFSGEVAEEFGVPWVAVWQALPTTLSAHFYTPEIRQKCAAGSDQTLDFIPGLSSLRVKDLPAEVICQDPARESVFARTLSEIGEKLPKATAVAVTCYEELVPAALNDDLKSKFKSYLNLGFLSMSLPLPPLPESASDETGCLSWLDKQSSNSVVYISFGTVAALPEKEVKSLAESLEQSKIPFIWSIKQNQQQNLPIGFAERTINQGKIVPWAPQSSVVAHDSVAVFVTHGGYNSVSESIVYGVPMICRPFFADQMLMARTVEVGWGIGVTVEGGAISKDGFLKDLEVFFPRCSERGKKMRGNVEELKKVVLMAAKDNGPAAKDFSKLVEIVSKV